MRANKRGFLRIAKVCRGKCAEVGNRVGNEKQTIEKGLRIIS
jgi:hypothetical protein